MEKVESADRPLLKTILTLVAINLALTVSFVALFAFVAIVGASKNEVTSDEIRPLPHDLQDEDRRVELLEEFLALYNTGRNEELREMFGESFKVKFSPKEFKEQMDVLRTLAPRVNEGAYSHYEFQEFSAGLTEYYLYYNVDTPTGLREFKMTFRKQGSGPLELTGVAFNTLN